ncbi:MAG TPA: hypothetical protein VG963_00980 [Polyangiaceae bacterium]|nr:hypothetical protein [Polyangiaceae bacterium]
MLVQLWSSFQEGGWAMYFIFALGFLGVGAGGRFAWRGEHELLPFLRWLAITLIACGVFGFLIGWQRTLQAALGHLTRFAPPDLPSLEQRLFIVMEGTKEALNCLSAALMFVVIVCLLGAIGQRRFPLPNPGALSR